MEYKTYELCLFQPCTFSIQKVISFRLKHLYTQASKATHSLHKNIRSNYLPVDLSLQLFDSLFTPILLYCCEVWGHEDFKILEKLHLRFCKLILGAPKATPSYIVYGELGRQPLSCFVNARMIKLWRKIIPNFV